MNQISRVTPANARLTDVPDWSKYHTASLRDTQPIDYPDPLELLLRDPRPFNPSPAVNLPRQADCGIRRFFIPDTQPTAFDRDLAVTVFVVLFALTPLLGVYAFIKLFE